MKDYVDRINGLLEVRGISKAELARRVHISTERANHMLGPTRRTEPDLKLLCDICDALETHPNYVLGFSDRPDPIHADQISQIRGIENEMRELRRLIRPKSS